MTGVLKMPMELGIGYFDVPPPDRVDDFDTPRRADRFRFADVLSAWIEVDAGGRVVDYAQAWGALIGATTMRVGSFVACLSERR